MLGSCGQRSAGTACVLKVTAPVSGRWLRYPWLSGLIATAGRPSVGSLMALCEENYATLCCLAPGLKTLHGDHRSSCRGDIDLHLEIIEQGRYTTLLRLTHFFPHDDGQVHRISEADPDTLLRVYHDARQVEVLDLRQTALPLHNHYRPPALEAKWKANLFLSKWLTYCVQLGHDFPGLGGCPSAEASLDLPAL